MHYTTSCNTQSSAPEDERDHCPKHVELIGIINKPLLLHLVGVYFIYFSVQVVAVDSYLGPYTTTQPLKKAIVLVITMMNSSLTLTGNSVENLGIGGTRELQ